MYQGKYDNENIKAEIICDSISPVGKRLTTMVVTFHRFILAEFNTHRMFSRNSASSRAIPISKMIERVESNPAMPVFWGKNQTGMSASEEISEDMKIESKYQWQCARDFAISIVKDLSEWEVHKQIANRLLEPFMWHTAIVSATEWGNFFNQRCSEFAQPEMRALADKMQYAYYHSTPKEVNQGEWHLPFINDEDISSVFEYYEKFIELHKDKPNTPKGVESRYYDLKNDWLKEISVARCARVSYLTHDGKREIEKDLELYEKLTEGMHWSPFEHVAIPATMPNQSYGNFKGWLQLRNYFKNENRTYFEYNLGEK